MFLSVVSQRTADAVDHGAVLPASTVRLLAGEIGMLDGIRRAARSGFARAFLPHEFAQFGVSLDESRRRFNEGLAQIKLLLEQENVSSNGEFHSFRNVTSLPRPTQRPHPPLWIAAISTPESFAFAGKMGAGVMSIPLEGEKMRSLFDIYRDAWRTAGHPGKGHVMSSFIMCCLNDRAQALSVGGAGANGHLRGLADAAKEWMEGASTKDYPGYDKMIAHIAADTIENQIGQGIGWIGAPSDLVDMIRGYNEKVGGIDSASLLVMPSTLSAEVAETSMRLFAREVLPKVAGL